MMKNWRQSWRRDSQMPSQAVTLMFIPTIIGLGFSKRAAFGKIGNKYERYVLGQPTLKHTRVIGKKRQASLHLQIHFCFTHLFSKLYSWAPGRKTSIRVKLQNNCR